VSCTHALIKNIFYPSTDIDSCLNARISSSRIVSSCGSCSQGFFCNTSNICEASPYPLGTVNNPLVITSWATLNNTRNNLTAYYVLTANLSSATDGYVGIGDNWQPIGNTTTGYRFAGNFNGNNNTISNLKIDLPLNYYVGLFGSVSGNISNIGLINVNVKGVSSVGGLIGSSYIATISNSYSTGNVTGGSSSVGGLIGSSFSSTISNSYSTGNVAGSSSVGGLIGSSSSSSSTISNSYSTGNVTGNNMVGGLIGSSSSSSISNSYSTGNVTGSSSTVGGLIGSSSSSSTMLYINHSYWDVNTSGQTEMCGSGTCMNTNGLITSQMKNQTVFINAGWNFTNIWAMDSAKNNGYAYLKWQNL
jgi:hypothetical protein